MPLWKTANHIVNSEISCGNYFLIKCKDINQCRLYLSEPRRDERFRRLYLLQQSDVQPGILPYRKSVTEQLEEGVRFFSRKYPEMKYLAYFQAYTNTYDELDSLTSKYEEALACPGVVGLIVGTRPDCMPDTLLDYFSALSQKKFVMIEYGLESTLDRTLTRINRGTYTCRIGRGHPPHSGPEHIHGSPLDLRPSGRKQGRYITPCRHPVRPSAHNTEASPVATYPRHAHG